jgi:FkbM family methyltransferase
VKHRYAGEDLTVSLQDPLAEGWYDRDWGPQAEIDMLRRGRLRSGARIFDLGAHQAVVALVMSRIVGDAGEVIAVEADCHNARVAEENVRMNGATNIRVIHAAATDEPGRVCFAEGMNGNVTTVPDSGSVQVDAVTVDGLAAEFGAPDVVFVDVEGYEAHVLAGSRRTLDQRATDFFVEVHDAETLAHTGTTAHQIFTVFASAGYKCVAVPATEDGVDGEWLEIVDGSELTCRRTFLIATAELTV